jgi:hypothetical protein
VRNNLGELALATGAAGRARAQYREALAIAIEISVPQEEARALEGIG